MLVPYWINSANLANVRLKIILVNYNQSAKFAKISHVKILYHTAHWAHNTQTHITQTHITHAQHAYIHTYTHNTVHGRKVNAADDYNYI